MATRDNSRSNSELERLGLTAAEIAAVARQGFVSAERRKRSMTVYKLRYRFAGRQRACYLGTDAAFAALIKTALARHPRAHRLNAELRALAREARRRLREAKQKLVPGIEQAGFRFHGYAVRRRRSALPITTSA
jgi:hypothetical protein